MRVNEIFYTLQGEGLHQGEPTIFVRLAGCNLECQYCDTSHKKVRLRVDAEDAVAIMEKFPAKLVCVTGGEPLLQTDTPEFCDKLAEKGYIVSIETNGSIAIDNVLKHEVVMDIKCPSSGMAFKMLYENLAKLKETDQLKFVVWGLSDCEYAECILDYYNPKCHVIFSPVWGTDYKELANWIMARAPHARMQIQLHKVVGLK